MSANLSIKKMKTYNTQINQQKKGKPMNPTRRNFIKNLALAGGAIAGTNSLNSINTAPVAPVKKSQYKRSDTDWFKDCRWGVFCHYLTNKEMNADDWNRQVDSFDTNRLADQLESCGTKYFFLTVGQNSGHYCAPNPTYDSIVGISPSKCSERDLVSDVYDSVSRRGIKLLAYLPSGAPASDPVAMEKLKWEWGFEGEWPRAWMTKRLWKRQVEFQEMWESVVRDWSLRWGKKVCGWWIDGCYFSDEMYRYPDPPNFRTFAEAMKAGNPESIVAYNGGVFIDMKLPRVVCMSEYEDYTAGEVARAFPVCPGRWVDGAQYHILSFLGKSWGRAPLRFVDEFVIGYTKDVTSKGGVVTWDVPISKTGVIPEEFLRQLNTLNRAMSRS